MTHFELVAHRGYPLRYPDNSLSGIRAALQAGALYVEIDVQLSSSGSVWLFHDPSLLRVAGCEGSLIDLDDHAIGALRAAETARFGTRFAAEPIARLSEVVAELQAYPGVFTFVEIKPCAVERYGAAPVVAAVAALLAPIAERVSIISFSMDCLRCVVSQTSLPHGLILESWDQLQGDARQIDSSHLFCNHEKLPPGALDVGTQLAVYEVTDPALARDLGQRGVQLVETYAFPEMREALGSPT